MKALLCREFGRIKDLEIEEVPEPVLGRGQVRVEVRAAGLNFPDALVVQGKYQLKPPLPFSPGSEFAGVVVDVAEDVQGFAAGDRVFGLTSFGAFAEQLVVDAERLKRMSEAIGFAEAAVLSMGYGAAIYALFERGRIASGESVMILGATGGAGLAAVELAKLAGARVLAVDGDDERLSHARVRGADAVFNYRSGGLRDAAKGFAENGVDLVLDPVGGDLGLEAVRCLGWKGRLLVFGFASGDIQQIPANLILLKGAELIGVFWGESQRRRDNRDDAHFAQILEWHAAGKLRPHIGRRFPFAQGAAALAALARGEITGKAVLEFGHGD